MPHAVGQKLGDARGLFFAIGGHQFAKRRAERRIGEGIDIDAVEQRFRESLADIVKRGPARVGGREFAKGLSKRGNHGAPVYGQSSAGATLVLKKG
jgi:hypothetical protein